MNIHNVNKRTGAIILLISLILLSGRTDLTGQSNIWVGSWSCAPYAAGEGNTPPAPYLANNTLRQVVRVSIGGDTLRMKFSNKTCSTPVTMNKVSIAVSTGGSAIDASTVTELTFDGSSSVTMAANASVISDDVVFPLDPSMRLAVSIHYGTASSAADITSHVASRTDSYLVSGDQVTAADFSGASVTAHWFHINTIDVIAPDTAGCVGVLGNSITDGYGLSGGLQNRWTDFMSQTLLDDNRTRQVGVLNLGIGATTVAGTGPTTGLSRFQDDILSQSGLRWMILFYGVNDIGWGRSATVVIDAYKELVKQARDLNIKVYGATLTPFKGHSYYTEAHEAVRNEVNEWIRTPGNFDACIDFDKIIRDPIDTARMRAEYSNDWLHPSLEGYELLGQGVDLNLFTEIKNTQLIRANAGRDLTLLDLENDGSQAVTLDASLSYTFGVEIVSYIWSEGGMQIASGEMPSVDLSVGIHNITLTLTDAEGNTDSDEVVISIQEDTGVWLEAECGTAGSLWRLETSATASNGYYLTIEPGNTSTGGAAGAPGLLYYTFDVREGGSYTLYARTICPNANDDSFWLKMDNGSYQMWNNIGPSAAWQWEAFNSDYSLTAGTHTLTISYREDGAMLDKLWITKNRAEVGGEGSAAGNCNTEALVIDAGTDAEYCNTDVMVQLGGNPTASGGSEPFTYSWDCISPDLGDHGATIADILDDHTAANPVIGSIFEINDTIIIELEVQDRFAESAKDTVRVVVSSLLIKGADSNELSIKQGESIEISPLNITNGIAPFSYAWTPDTDLSDASIRNPLAQPDSTTTYEVQVTDALGCTAVDLIFLTIIQNTTGLGTTAARVDSHIYPNPLSSYSKLYLAEDPGARLRLKVFNTIGQLVLEDHFQTREYPIGNKGLSSGVYYYLATDKEELVACGKFILA